MNIFELYSDKDKHTDLVAIFNDAAQKHPDTLGAAFIEKDVWVTEILRLLFDEGLLDGKTIAFKGGTALSKRWKAIERFSEDIDLSIHWHEMLNTTRAEDEEWNATNSSNSQKKKFREEQAKRLGNWLVDFASRLEARLRDYGIEGLGIKQLSNEQLEVHYPIVSETDAPYHLGPILLEFGARNRGRPTEPSTLTTYLGEIPEYGESLTLPIAQSVMVFDPNYIIWEKLTALHQFCTSDNQPKAARLARHWYDVDCMMCRKIVDPLTSSEAMNDVIEMKEARWSMKGVNYKQASCGGICLIPQEPLLSQIAEDYSEMVKGGMFFKTPDDFDAILKRLSSLQDQINQSLKQD